MMDTIRERIVLGIPSLCTPHAELHVVNTSSGFIFHRIYQNSVGGPRVESLEVNCVSRRCLADISNTKLQYLAAVQHEVDSFLQNPDAKRLLQLRRSNWPNRPPGALELFQQAMKHLRENDCIRFPKFNGRIAMFAQLEPSFNSLQV